MRIVHCRDFKNDRELRTGKLGDWEAGRLKDWELKDVLTKAQGIKASHLKVDCFAESLRLFFPSMQKTSELCGGSFPPKRRAHKRRAQARQLLQSPA